jgi:HAD superfamily hydrolase (TIGR01662 family)
MQYKAILFDLGNTLIHFTGNWSHVFSMADRRLSEYLIDMGIYVNPETFPVKFRQRTMQYHAQREIDFIEHTTTNLLIDVLRELGHQNISQSDISLALEQSYKQSQKYWIPEENAVSILEALKSRGYKLGIISNASNDADVQLLVDKVKIGHLFDFVLSSAHFGIRKPSPLIFEEALSQWPQVEPSQVVMVGDTLNADILGANKMGITSVWLTKRINKVEMQDKDSQIIPNEILENLDDLPKLMAKLN